MNAVKKILLVEDEPTLQRILGSVLGDAGHRVEVTSSAEDALAILRRDDDVDLLLTDKNLPGMNGLELLAAVRALEDGGRRPVPRVLVTGYPSRDSARDVLGHGADAYLVKPFRSLSHATQRIRAILDGDAVARRNARVRARVVADLLVGGEKPRVAPDVMVALQGPLAARIEALLREAGCILLPARPRAGSASSPSLAAPSGEGATSSPPAPAATTSAPGSPSSLPSSSSSSPPRTSTPSDMRANGRPSGVSRASARTLVTTKVEDAVEAIQGGTAGGAVVIDDGATFHDLVSLIELGTVLVVDPAELRREGAR